MLVSGSEINMPTIRETILTALHVRLQTLPATALRGEVLPERIPAAGLVILRDGDPGEPEVTMSPLRYHYDFRVSAAGQAAQTSGTVAGCRAGAGCCVGIDSGEVGRQIGLRAHDYDKVNKILIDRSLSL